MNPLLLLYSSLAVLLFCFSIPTLSLADIANEPLDHELGGFSVDLIHRDSPLSPLSRTICPDKSYESSLKKSNYTYLMKVKVGGDEKFATPDTGSNLIWLNGEDCQGNACTSHTKLKPTGTPPQKLCEICSKCDICLQKKCTQQKNICRYNATYGDNFTTGGVLTRGEFSFPCSDGIEHKFKKIWFGISDYSNGTFENTSAGIIGLARGELSLIDQLCQGKFNFKFSYCFPQHPNSISKLSFGNQVTVSEGKSAKLLDTESGYYVNLININVNQNEKEVSDQKNQKIIIDSGTTGTYLNSELFHFFSESVKKEIGHKVITSKIGEFDVCFKHDDEKNVKIPIVKFDFEGKTKSSKVTVELKKENYLHEVSYDNTNWLCLMVFDAKDDTHYILGSRAQMGFLVAFDITSKEVSFDPHDCDEHKVDSLAFDITRQEASFDAPDCGKQKNVESILHTQE